MAEDIMGSADYLRVELHEAARSEMVTGSRTSCAAARRSIWSCTTTTSQTPPGSREVAEILFGADDADRRLAEYFGGVDDIPEAVRCRRPATRTPRRTR